MNLEQLSFPFPIGVNCVHYINFLNCGGRLDALQEQLGHRDINTTRIYLRLSDEDVKREVAKIQF